MAQPTQISGSRSLHRLIYCSRSTARTAADMDQQVTEVIEASVRNNARVGVTGLLLAHEGWFVQTLEGPAREVMTTYGRVLEDRRHHEAKVLASGPAEGRLFGRWNMCARRLGPADAAILDTLGRKGAFEPPALGAAAALKLLSAVAGIQARAA